jgi:hypothetical protein
VRPTIRVGLTALCVGALAQVVAQAGDVVLAFWDAQAHLDIARRVIDSTTPGLQMLGTVWLPVPHLLYLPFTQVDRLWWSGLAGGLVGLLAFVLLAVSVHDIVRRRSGHPTAAWIAVAVVGCNPTLLYLQTTAMTEPLLLGFLAAATALLDRWWTEADDGLLLGAGAWTALAVGSRYDGWFFAAVAAVLVLVRRRRLQPVLRYAALPAAVVVGWLVYNWHYFGDPLEFQRGIWSAASQQAGLADQGLLPTRAAPYRDLEYYLGAVGMSAGWLVLAIGTVGSLLAARRPQARPALVLLWSVLPFNLLALFAGQSVIALPWTEPAGVLNIRYGIMLLPALVVGAVLGFEEIGRRRGMVLALSMAAALQVGHFAWKWPQAVGGLREGLAIRDGDAAQMRASRWLAAHYDRGRVLIAPAVNISPRTRIRLRDRVYPWTWELGDAALAAPAEIVDWVVVDRRAPDDPVTVAVEADTSFTRRFQLAFSERALEIWQRR